MELLPMTKLIIYLIQVRNLSDVDVERDNN
jgi:hypothetical protein